MMNIKTYIFKGLLLEIKNDNSFKAFSISKLVSVIIIIA